MTHLHRLSEEGIPAALEMAHRYRLLNEPEETESICLDILAVEPTHQETLVTLLLALTDKFSTGELQPAFQAAQEVVGKLDSSYCKSYYSGIVFERRAKYHLKQGGPGSGKVAYEWFVQALKAFDAALKSCDPDNQDAVLRWNSCVRFIERYPDIKQDDNDQSGMLLDTFESPH